MSLIRFSNRANTWYKKKYTVTVFDCQWACKATWSNNKRSSQRVLSIILVFVKLEELKYFAEIPLRLLLQWTLIHVLCFCPHCTLIHVLCFYHQSQLVAQYRHRNQQYVVVNVDRRFNATLDCCNHIPMMKLLEFCLHIHSLCGVRVHRSLLFT